jgi:hypothetical protein
VHAARRGLKARVFRRGQLAGRDSRRPGGETNSPVLYPFPYQIWFDWDVFAIGFPGASRCMHAAMVDETGVAPRNQQRSGRGGHAGAAAGNPESSDEGIRVAPRKTAPHCLGSRLLMLRGAARQGVAAAGIRLRTLFCRSVELGLGLVAHTRSPGWKPGGMIHANPRLRAAVRLAGRRPLGINPALQAWHPHKKPRVETRGHRV